MKVQPPGPPETGAGGPGAEKASGCDGSLGEGARRNQPGQHQTYATDTPANPSLPLSWLARAAEGKRGMLAAGRRCRFRAALHPVGVA